MFHLNEEDQAIVHKLIDLSILTPNYQRFS
jgi:hypothetical protein